MMTELSLVFEVAMVLARICRVIHRTLRLTANCMAVLGTGLRWDTLVAGTVGFVVVCLHAMILLVLSRTLLSVHLTFLRFMFLVFMKLIMPVVMPFEGQASWAACLEKTFGTDNLLTVC